MSDWLYHYHYNLGLDLKQQGALQQSANHHVKALERAPDLPFAKAWHNAGAALLRVDEAVRARPYLEEALRRYAAAQVTGPPRTLESHKCSTAKMPRQQSLEWPFSPS